MGQSRMKRKSTYKLVFIWLAVLAVIIVPRITEAPNERTGYQILKVIDGDTLSVLYNGESVGVRLIGVDAPESVHPEEERNSVYGIEAMEHMEELVADSSYVYLVFDQETYDGYGRLLAYVYLDENGDFEDSLNYRLVEDGYAVNKEYPPNVAYKTQLRMACDEAADNKRGLWHYDDIQGLWGKGN